MSPFGPYADFDECVAKNADKSSPEGYCAWLHHKITGTWPGEMAADKFPSVFMDIYDAALVAQKSESEAYKEAEEATKAAGFELSRFGWVKQYQAPKVKSVSDVDIFAAGTWTDSAGFEKTWTTEDLDKIVEAFEAGVPIIVPIKCGHTSDEFNQKIAEALGVPVEVVTGDGGQGQIKLGNMTSLKRDGNILTAAFNNVPEAIADLIEGGLYSTVSVEIEDKIGDYGPVITGVALLGAEEPAVDKATLERALVFGGSRKGARVWSFKVGEDIPIHTLRAEFDEIRGKLADIIKGKRGAPLFRALFGNLTDIFEKMVGGKHSAPEGGNMKYEPSPEALLQKGRPPADWWDRCTAKVSGWPGVNDVDAFCGSVWFHDDPIPAGSFSSDEAANQAEIKFKEGGKYQMSEELKQIAAALGLGEEATVEDVLAAIKGLVEGAAELKNKLDTGGDMAAELKKAFEKIETLEATVNGQTSLAAWKEKTAEFTAIPGTPHEHAVKLAEIESKAGKDAADAQFAALEAANKLAAQATESLGTARQNTEAQTTFEAEVTKYMGDHPDKTRVEALKAVSHARPDLYFARRGQ